MVGICGLVSFVVVDVRGGVEVDVPPVVLVVGTVILPSCWTMTSFVLASFFIFVIGRSVATAYPKPAISVTKRAPPVKKRILFIDEPIFPFLCLLGKCE